MPERFQGCGIPLVATMGDMMAEKKLTPFEMEQELRRFKDSIDLSCVEDIEFLRHYIEVLDSAYMQQASSLRMHSDENRRLWESNERITKELQAEIAELKAKRAKSEDVEKVKQALQNAKGAYDALKATGAHEHLPGYEGCLERLGVALEAVERLGKGVG